MKELQKAGKKKQDAKDKKGCESEKSDWKSYKRREVNDPIRRNTWGEMRNIRLGGLQGAKSKKIRFKGLHRREK